MAHGFLSLAPALVTILVALALRRVALALFCGVAAGALVLGGFRPLPALAGLGRNLLGSFTDLDRLKIVAFIMLIGGLLELISASGAYNAFGRAVGSTLGTGRKARMAAWGLSCCLFFDDYANVLISGTAMRTVTDRNRVSAAILAYLVDVVALLASVMLVSTWAAYEGALMVGAARAIHVQGGLSVFFIQSLPYHYYTYLAIFLSLLVAWTGKWFGSRLDDHAYSPADESRAEGAGARPRHVLVPILTLLGVAVGGLFGFGVRALHALGEPVTVIRILGAAPSVNILIGATLLAILVASAMLLGDGVLGHARVRVHFHRGLGAMASIAFIVLLASSLSQMSKDLGTGLYLAQACHPFLGPATLPLVVFLLALLVTLTTGFSWGSMAIVMPVAFQLAAALGGTLLPVVSAAVITGACAGEHLVPYSEKAVMTAAACGIPPIYHVKTQVFQTLAALVAAGSGFLLIGLGVSLVWTYLLPAALLLGLHWAFARDGGFHPGWPAVN